MKTREHGALEADLYIDCSGFRALLIGTALGSPFRSVSDTLFCDTALAVQVPYPSEDSPIASQTTSTAQRAGWIWDIGLPTRRGVGHVYSSAHTSDDEAVADLCGCSLATAKRRIDAAHLCISRAVEGKNRHGS